MQNIKTRILKCLNAILNFISHNSQIIINTCIAVSNLAITIFYCNVCLGGNNNDKEIMQALVGALYPTTASSLISSFSQIAPIIKEKRNSNPSIVHIVVAVAYVLISFAYIFGGFIYLKIETLRGITTFVISSCILCVIALIIATLQIISAKKRPSINCSLDYSLFPIEWSVKNCVIQKNKSFASLQKVCIPQEAITFLWKAMGSPKPISKEPYKNQNKDWKYTKPMVWAHEHNIDLDMEFKKGQANLECTLAMIIQILWTLNSCPSINDNEKLDVPSEYLQAISWAIKNGIIEQNLDKGSLDKPCTEAQILCILHHYFTKCV